MICYVRVPAKLHSEPQNNYSKVLKLLNLPASNCNGGGITFSLVRFKPRKESQNQFLSSAMISIVRFLYIMENTRTTTPKNGWKRVLSVRYSEIETYILNSEIVITKVFGVIEHGISIIYETLIKSQRKFCIITMAPYLSETQLVDFLNNGYIILRNVIPAAMLQKAETLTDAGYNRTDPDVQGAPFRHLREHPDLLALFSETLLNRAASQLLGGSENVCLREGAPQVAYTEPFEKERPSKWSLSATALNEPHPAKRWHVDSSHGRFGPIASDFMILVGVALSEGQNVDQNHGQLVVFPSTYLHSKSRVPVPISDSYPVVFQIVAQ